MQGLIFDARRTVMNKSTLAGAAMIAAAAIALPVIAWSQNPPQPPTPMATPDRPDHDMHRHGWGRWGKNESPQQACADRIAKHAGFVAYMGAKLNLTAQQKPLWDKAVPATHAAPATQPKTSSALPAPPAPRTKH